MANGNYGFVKTKGLRQLVSEHQKHYYSITEVDFFSNICFEPLSQSLKIVKLLQSEQNNTNNHRNQTEKTHTIN